MTPATLLRGLSIRFSLIRPDVSQSASREDYALILGFVDSEIHGIDRPTVSAYFDSSGPLVSTYPRIARRLAFYIEID